MNFKFIGCIDCNTEIELENITQDEYNGIEKFIRALSNANCSRVEGTTKLSSDTNRIININDKLHLSKRFEDLT